MYDFQITDSGCIVRNSMGDIIIMTDTEEEAREYMENNSTSSRESWVEKAKRHISPYDQFDNYTQNLKGKMYYNDKFGSCFEKPLRKFAKSFEKLTEYRVEIMPKYIGGELIYMVNDVY